MAAEPTATPGQTTTHGAAQADATGDGLTLHHGIVRRWEGEGALAAVRSEAAGGAVRGAERLIAGLPGLATLTGSFGPQAWDLATAIATNPQLLQRFSLDARTMSVAELADLVQVVLEAEEPRQDLDLEAALEAAGARSAKGRAAAPAKAASAQGKAAPAKASGAKLAAKATAARRAPGMTRKLATVKRLVSELRAAETQRSLVGESAPDDGDVAQARAAEVGSRHPDALGSVRPSGETAGAAEPGQALAAAAGKTAAGAAAAQPVAANPAAMRRLAARRMGPQALAAQRWLDPMANAMDVAGRAPRALRMAESAAELAFLQPSADVGAAWNGAVSNGATAEESSASEPGAASQPRGARRAAAGPVPALAPQAGQAAPQAHAVSAGSAAAAGGTQRYQAGTARSSAAADRAVVAPRAWATAAGAQAASPAAWAMWVARGGGRAPTTAAAPAAVPAAAAALQAASDSTSVQGAAVSARNSASPFAALTRSVAFAAQRLERWHGAQQPLHASSALASQAGAGAAKTGAAADKTAPRATAAARAQGAAGSQAPAFASTSVGPDAEPGQAAAGAFAAEPAAARSSRASVGDRYAALFGAGKADVAALGQLLPRWTDWLARTDRAQQGRREADAGPSADAAARAAAPGYAATETGAGDLLLPAATEAWAEEHRDAEAGAAQGRAPTTGSARAARGRAAAAQGTGAAPQAFVAAQPAAARRAAAVTGVPQWLVPQGTFAAATAALARTAAARADVARSANAQGLAAERTEFATRSAAAPAAAQAAWQASAAAGGAQASGRAGAGEPALAAAGFAGRLSLRHLAGLVPMAEAARWLPASVEGGSRLASAPAAAAAEKTDVLSQAFAAAAAPRAGSATFAARELRGPLAGAAGAGEYLVPGEEVAGVFESVGGSQAVSERSRARADGARPAASVSAGLLRALGLPQASGAPARADVAGGSAAAPGSAAAAGRLSAAAAAPAGKATAGGLAWTRAAAAAIDRIVAHSANIANRAGMANGAGTAGDALAGSAKHGAFAQLSPSTRRSLLDFAASGGLEQLAARPGGLRDAITPWLEQHVARGAAASRPDAGSAQRDLRIAGASETDLVALQPDVAFADAAAPESASRRAGVSGERSAKLRAVAGDSAGAQAPGTTSSPRSEAAPRFAGAARLQQLAAGLRDVREPAALRAALALFESGAAVPAAAESVARAFLSRWFGQPAAAPGARTAAAREISAKDGAAQELLALRRGEAWTGASTPARESAAAQPTGRLSPAAAREEPSEIVLTGLAALAALQQPAAERELGFQAHARSLRGAETERELLAPSAETASSAEGGAAEASASSMASAPSASRRGKSTAVQLHEFAPVGLRRGRGLLSSTRRGAGLLRVSPRGPGAQRVGYGASALGTGEMVGLGNTDSSEFFGDSGPMPAAAAGADRLSGLVQARRSAHGGRGHVAAVAAGGGAQRSFVSPRSQDGAGAIPGDFSFGSEAALSGAALINPAAALQSAVEDSARYRGATAAGRGIQAGAMARVLSVTSEPSANMLPLVAPAAHALVAAAAAKPLSESISTSGSDPTQGMPMLGQSHHGKGGGHDGHAQAAEHAEQAAQDLDALAQKIARSVMVRVKKERERRGLHG